MNNVVNKIFFVLICLLILSSCGGGDGGSTGDNDDNSVGDTVTHNGVTYVTIASPNTGRVWLDRNLGALRVCTDYNDEQCYGEYYQWGRNADGHEKSTSSVSDVLATSVTNVDHGDFIRSGVSPYDWADNIDNDGSQRQTNWSKTDGSSICPVGFRVPTETELEAEGIQNIGHAFSQLKLPAAGERGFNHGLIINQGSTGRVWSSLPSQSGGIPFAGVLNIYSDLAGTEDVVPSYGFSVRCIKD